MSRLLLIAFGLSGSEKKPYHPGGAKNDLYRAYYLCKGRGKFSTLHACRTFWCIAHGLAEGVFYLMMLTIRSYANLPLVIHMGNLEQENLCCSGLPAHGSA